MTIGTDRSSTGQTPAVDTTLDDPLQLIGDARTDGDHLFRELDQLVDDSFARSVPRDGKYFRGKRYSLYRDSRRQVSPTLDYAEARPAVDLVLRQRNALVAAIAAWDRARAAIAPADQLDLDEADDARRSGRPVEARHGAQARADAEAADMSAAFALIDAEEGERALTEALSAHAFAIAEARQVSILARRARYLDALRRAGEEAAAIRAEEDDLGFFEAKVVLPLINPGQELATRLAGSDDELTPEGGTHAHTVGEVLGGDQQHPHGRRLPRGPEGDLDRALDWGRRVPWPTAWRYTEAGAVPRATIATEPTPEAPSLTTAKRPKRTATVKTDT